MNSDAKPQRIQLSRRKGFKLQDVSRALNGLDAVKCARPGKWGNQFVVMADPHPDYSPQTAAEAVRMHAASVDKGYMRIKIMNELRGKNLACFCALYECKECGAKFSTYPIGGCTCGAPLVHSAPCHVDTLLRIANE